MGCLRVRYTRTAVVLHWLIALLILGQIGFGWYLEGIPRGVPLRSIVVNLHKSTGLLLGLLILVRVGWRVGHPAPPLPGSVPAWERVAASANHVGLYACMVLMPTAGYLASNFSRWGVSFFNSVKLPPWGPDDKMIYAVLNTTHVVTSYVFVALIAVHILAALRHLAMRDGIFPRMWPGRSESDDMRRGSPTSKAAAP
jgi:cytochrome b561